MCNNVSGTKNMCEIVFVILHYLTINDTVEAVESIKNKIDTDSYRIIVVDNGSGNGTGEQLKTKYNNEQRVDVVVSGTNEGFARGMNIGYRFAVQSYSPEFIVLLNNDIVLKEDDFYTKIKTEFYLSHFAVLGPKIITADGKFDSSPLINAAITLEQIKSVRRYEKRQYIIELFHLRWLAKLKNSIKNHSENDTGVFDDSYYNSRHEDVVLQGSCLIFSNEYIKRFISGLDDSTFLYHEEEILYLRVHSLGLKMVYNPDLSIYHKEDSATNAMITGNRKKALFKFKNLIKSNKELLRIRKEIGE